MILKFSLSGGPWIISDSADLIYSRVVDLEIPAWLITTMWSDKNCVGSVDISLAQISCRFSFVNATAAEIIAIQQTFMHDTYIHKDLANELYIAMLEVNNAYKDKDDDF